MRRPSELSIRVFSEDNPSSHMQPNICTVSATSCISLLSSSRKSPTSIISSSVAGTSLPSPSTWISIKTSGLFFYALKLRLVAFIRAPHKYKPLISDKSLSYKTRNKVLFCIYISTNSSSTFFKPEKRNRFLILIYI